MPPDEITDPRLRQRVARFKGLAVGEVACLDTLFPEPARKIAHVIGPAACEDPALGPAIPEVGEFHLIMIRAEAGKGASLHSHPCVEMFMPLSGEWTIYWGDEGEHLLLAINGENSGPIEWLAKTLESAKSEGDTLDADGFVTPIRE